jgi:hypothetical protein
VDEAGREQVRVGVTIFEDQHRWLRQRAFDLRLRGGFSELLREIIDRDRRQAATDTPGEPS